MIALILEHDYLCLVPLEDSYAIDWPILPALPAAVRVVGLCLLRPSERSTGSIANFRWVVWRKANGGENRSDRFSHPWWQIRCVGNYALAFLTRWARCHARYFARLPRGRVILADFLIPSAARSSQLTVSDFTIFPSGPKLISFRSNAAS